LKRILLDTDIGTDVDDAMALALALASPELELEGVTVVHADAPLRARIARAILRIVGRQGIPVVPGASLPLEMPLPKNFHWMPVLRGHEGVGLLSPEELEPTTNLEATAADAARFIIERAKALEGELSLVTIGSLSNIGRALQLEPRLKDWIKDITAMGSTVDASRFPFPPMLETNFNCDPLATRLVFESGIPLTIVPMEITTQVFLDAAMREQMRSWHAPLADALVTMMDGMLVGMDSLSSEVGLSQDFYQGRTFMHDPLAIAVALGSPLVRLEHQHVRLEVIDNVLRTMPDPDREPNVRVAVDVDAPAFVGFWLERIERLSSTR
jgi:purine nucleosidase